MSSHSKSIAYCVIAVSTPAILACGAATLRVSAAGAISAIAPGAGIGNKLFVNPIGEPFVDSAPDKNAARTHSGRVTFDEDGSNAADDFYTKPEDIDTCKQAIGFLDSNDPNKAITAINDIISRDKKNAAAYIIRERANRLIGRYDDAMRDCNAALHRAPRLAVAYYDRGVLQAINGNYRKAISDCTEALVLDPRLTGAHAVLGYAYEALGMNDAASKEYCRKNDLPAAPVIHNPLFVSLRSDSCSCSGISLPPRYPCSKDKLGDALYSHIKDIDLCRAGVQLLAEGSYKAAESKLESVAVSHPQCEAAYVLAGMSWRLSIQVEPARTHTVPPTPNLLANRLRGLEEDIRLCTEAIKRNPNYAMAYVERGSAFNSYPGLDERYKAIADYTKAIELDPRLALAYDFRGHVHYQLGQNQSAVEDCTKAISLDPSAGNAYNDRALAYEDLGLYKEAIADYGAHIRMHPDEANVYFDRGEFFFRRGNFDDALCDYEKAMELGLQPGNHLEAILFTRNYSMASNRNRTFIYPNHDAVSMTRDGLITEITYAGGCRRTFAWSKSPNAKDGDDKYVLTGVGINASGTHCYHLQQDDGSWTVQTWQKPDGKKTKKGSWSEPVEESCSFSLNNKTAELIQTNLNNGVQSVVRPGVSAVATQSLKPLSDPALSSKEESLDGTAPMPWRSYSAQLRSKLLP